MAVTACVLNSERWLDEVILRGNAPVDVGGATLSESFTLPANFGDAAILSILVAVSPIATVPVTATFPRGVRALVFSADASSIVDIVGVGALYATGGDGAAFTGVQGSIDPDAMTLWRQGELLNFAMPEMDANAAPTADLIVLVKCTRVGGKQVRREGPIQLTR